MRAGDWERAWQINDEVLAARDPRTRDDPTLPYHLRWVWDGTPLERRDVLVRCYHGLGDTLQFARFIPQAAARAASLTLEAQPELCEVLSIFSGVCSVVPFDVARPRPAASCNVEIMELAHALRIRDAGVNVDYLERGSVQRDRPLSLGVCWEAGNWDASRSIPAPLVFDLLRHSGATLYSLQRGGQPVSPTSAGLLSNPGDNSMRVTDTAALIGTLDAVVTVDGFVAHLAGAMGKPAYVLLKKDADWRWMMGDGTAWYPRARLLRQCHAGDWDWPLAELGALLPARVDVDSP